MTTQTPAIVGRDAELQTVERFLDELGAAASALVIEGEAGIGKTTVWREGVAGAERRSYRVLRAQPAESESTLSYTALADLIGSAFDEARSELPAPQQRGLEVALLRADPDASTDPRTIATGLVSVLAALAADRPLVVAIDDVQWLDRASERALEFAVRRLPVGVALLLSRRTESGVALQHGPELAVPPEQLVRVPIGPLSLAALHHLIAGRLGGAPSRLMLVRLTSASGGNPFYALEIARALGAESAERGLGDPLPVPPHLHALVAARLDALSPAARGAVLVTAAIARPTKRAVLAQLEQGDTGLLEAEQSGILTEEAGRLRFTHPLLASAVYGSASLERRRALHRRLAETTADSEGRARHLAQSEVDPHEPTAAELELAAERAARRGAQDAAAELYDAAHRLTPAGLTRERLRRLLGEASALLAAGELGQARVVAESALADAPPGTLRAESLFLLSQIAWVDSTATAVEQLERALAEAGDDRRLRGRIEAKLAAFSMRDQRVAVAHADAAAALLDEDEDPGLLAYALVNSVFFGAQVGLGARPELLNRALRLEERAGPDAERSSLFLIWFSSVDDFDAARERHLLEDRWYRDRGEAGWQAEKQALLADVELRAGNGALAERLAEESCATIGQMGPPQGPWAIPFAIRSRIDAQCGRIARARETLRPIVEEMEGTGSSWFAALVLNTLGEVELAAGDPAAAAVAFERSESLLESIGVICPVGVRIGPDHIEALVATGELEQAGRALERLEQRGRLLPRLWIDATLPRSRALVTAAGGDPAGALALLEQAHGIEQLPFELGRTLLTRGQLQRRLKRKLDAAQSLGRGLELFERIGAVSWAARSQAELDRIGLRRRDPHELTATERRIAELTASGLTNREVAQAAFVSPKTVEANLARVYRKLGISSRAELGARIGAQPPAET